MTQVRPHPARRKGLTLAAALVALGATGVGADRWLHRRMEREAATVARGRPYVTVDHRRRTLRSVAEARPAYLLGQAVAYKLWLPNEVEFGGSGRFREMHLGLRFSETERYLWSFSSLSFSPAGRYLF